MKRIKNLLPLLTIMIVAAISMTACGNKNTLNETDAPTVAATAVPETTKAPETTVPEVETTVPETTAAETEPAETEAEPVAADTDEDIYASLTDIIRTMFDGGKESATNNPNYWDWDEEWLDNWRKENPDGSLAELWMDGIALFVVDDETYARSLEDGTYVMELTQKQFNWMLEQLKAIEAESKNN